MVQLRHAGIYVSDMNKMVKFYTDVFNMHKICENVIQKDSLIEELLGPGSVLITKLITDYGKITGSGDMLELIYFFIHFLIDFLPCVYLLQPPSLSLLLYNLSFIYLI